MKEVIETEASMLSEQIGFAEEAPKLNSSNEEMQKVEKVKETPFSIVTVDGKCAITMGRYNVSEWVEESDKQKLLDDIKAGTWALIMGAIGASIAVNEEYKVIMKGVKENEQG